MLNRNVSVIASMFRVTVAGRATKHHAKTLENEGGSAHPLQLFLFHSFWIFQYRELRKLT